MRRALHLGLTVATAFAATASGAWAATHPVAGWRAERALRDTAGRWIELKPKGQASAVLATRQVTALRVVGRARRCGPGQPLRVRVDGTLTGVRLNEPTAARLVAGRHRLSIRNVGRAACRVRLQAVELRERVPVGTALSATALSSERYREVARNTFEVFTPENELKMERTQPREGVFDFGDAEAVMAFAADAARPVHGHALIFGNQLPGWLVRDPLTGAPRRWERQALLAVMRRHITTVMQHFRGRITTWDVVNEPLNADGSFRSNFWFEQLGPAYVTAAFTFAAQADPTAKLYLNEIGMDTDGPKAAAARRLIRAVRAAGGRVDGVGLQMHLQLDRSPDEPAIAEGMRAFAAEGLDVAVSELDVAIEPHATGEGLLARQARTYAAVAGACQAVAACVRLSVWGVSDAVSWLGPQRRPLPIDAAYEPKPALEELNRHLRAPPGHPW